MTGKFSNLNKEMTERVAQLKNLKSLLFFQFLETRSTFTDLFMWDVKEPTPLFEKNEGRGVAKNKNIFWNVSLQRNIPSGLTVAHCICKSSRSLS